MVDSIIIYFFDKWAYRRNTGYGAGDTVETIKKLSSESSVLENYTIEDRLANDNQISVKEWLVQLRLLNN